MEGTQEPSNIHWENLQLKGFEYASRIIIAILIILVIAGIGAFILIKLEHFKERLHLQFPEVECEVLTETYPEDQELLKEYAILEYHNMNELGMTDEALLELSTSNLQCY